MRTNNAYAFVKEMIEVIKDMQKMAMRNEASEHECPLATRAGEFLANVFVSRDSSAHLSHFKGVFPAMWKLGAKRNGFQIVLEEMAGFGDDTSDWPHFGKMDVVSRNAFRESPCFQGFRSARASKSLSQAKALTETSQRRQLLQQIVDSDPPPEMLREAQTILQASDESIPLPSRVAWALEDTRAPDLIASWCPDSHVSAILRVAGETPATGGMPYDTFLRCTDCMIKAGVQPLNPVVADAVAFMAMLEERQPPMAPWPQWLAVLQRLALVEKLKLQKDFYAEDDESFAGGPDAPDGVVAVEREALDYEQEIFHTTKAFVKEPRNPLPAWAQRWKTSLSSKAEAGAKKVAYLPKKESRLDWGCGGHRRR